MLECQIVCQRQQRDSRCERHGTDVNRIPDESEAPPAFDVSIDCQTVDLVGGSQRIVRFLRF